MMKRGSARTGVVLVAMLALTVLFGAGCATGPFGEVTLTGEVPTEEIKRLAAAIAQDTSGVNAVHNNLTVNPGVSGNPEAANIGDRVADLEIKTLVTDQLAQAPELKDERITVQVSKRRVSLDGTVDSPAQRRAADRIALLVPGVQELTSNLIVSTAAVAPVTTFLTPSTD